MEALEKKENCIRQIQENKSNLQKELRDKVKALRIVLQLKQAKKKFENEIKEIDNTEKIVRILEGEFGNKAGTRGDIAKVCENVEETKKKRETQINDIEKNWENEIFVLKNLYNYELGLWECKNKEFNDLIVNGIAENDSISQLIQNAYEDEKKLLLEIGLKQKTWQKVKEKYESINSDMQIKLFQAHSALYKEREAVLLYKKEAEDLESYCK